jgi:lysophospholipase
MSEPKPTVRRKEGHFSNREGLKLYYQVWSATQAPAQGDAFTLVVTHGLGEHSDPYCRLGEAMAMAGHDVLAWDLRGHGRSDGKRAVIRSFNDYTNDLQDVITAALERGKPVVVVGHSMGGLITCKYLIDNPTNKLAGFVLSSPLVGIAVEIPRLKEAAGRWLGKFFPELTLFNEIKFTDLTHDRAVIADFEIDTLRHDRVSTRLYLEILSALDYVPARASKITLPALVQQAGADRVVSRPRTEEFFSHLGSEDKTLHIYESFCHEIYNETERARPFADLTKWLALREKSK